jgi:hypothetical protein
MAGNGVLSDNEILKYSTSLVKIQILPYVLKEQDVAQDRVRWGLL